LNMETQELAKIIEALLFAADRPIPERRFKELLPDVRNGQLEEAIQHLQEHYRDHAFQIIRVAGGYQIVTRREFHNWVRALYTSRTRSRLSRAALETLAIIAYKQPVSRIEIEAIRGVNSDGVIGTLLERNLIEIKGRAETVGRPLLYGTTEEFLRYFGLNDLSELPKMEEIEAMLRQREESRQAESEESSEEVASEEESDTQPDAT